MNDIEQASWPEGMPTPFVVLGLPRSRTAWLSKFLSYGPWVCGHDELRHCRSLEDINSWFMQPFIGTAETGAAFWWRLLDKMMPDCRVVVVRRSVFDVMESVIKTGLQVDKPVLLNTLKKIDAKLNQIEVRLPRVLSVKYEDLTRTDVCMTVFEYCLGIEFNFEWWQYWNAVNVQANLGAINRYRMAHLPQLMRLASIAKHQILADLASKNEKAPYGILEIKEERFETSFPDAQKLFAEHCVEIGEPPDEWTRNNIPVIAQMDKMGLLQIMTARANGRMFGYLMSMVGTPLGEAEGKTATHTLFYASKEWPGAGMKLQRAALAALRAKGVDNVYMRSGVGAGARVETVYKRMGAEYEGRLFKIRLE